MKQRRTAQAIGKVHRQHCVPASVYVNLQESLADELVGHLAVGFCAHPFSLWLLRSKLKWQQRKLSSCRLSCPKLKPKTGKASAVRNGRSQLSPGKLDKNDRLRLVSAHCTSTLLGGLPTLTDASSYSPKELAIAAASIRSLSTNSTPFHCSPWLQDSRWWLLLKLAHRRLHSRLLAQFEAR